VQDDALPPAGIAAVFAGALGVRAGMVDWARVPDAAALAAHEAAGWPRKLTPFVGHEDLLLRAFAGHPPDPSSRAWPAAVALARGLGAVTGDPRALLGVSLVAGAAAAALVAVWTGRRHGASAGLWAGALVALLGEHAAWSTSAYPVMLAHALLVAAFVARNRVVAGLLVAGACSLRPDLAPLALLRGVPGLIALPVAAGWLWAVPSADPGDPLASLTVNWAMVRYLGPPVLLVGLVGLVEKRAWPLAAAALATHLVGGLFADYGARHALLGGVALCALGGVAAARLRHLPGIVLAVGLGFDAARIAQAWHTPRAPAAAVLDLPEPDGTCIEVSGEPPIDGQPLPSHLSIRQGDVQPVCLVWGEEDQHSAWTSRGLRDRARRMRTVYRLTPVAKVAVGRGGRVRVLHRLEPRW
jgi:hypothetical protein